MDAGFCSQCGRVFSQAGPAKLTSRRRGLWFGGAAVLAGVAGLIALALLTGGDRTSPAPPAAATATAPLVAGAPTSTVPPASPTVAPGSPLSRSLQATVQILVPVDGERGRFSTGSGSVLTSKGHVLTNYHVLVDETTGKPFNQRGEVYVAVSPPDLRGEPEVAYRAQVVELDQADDLALLLIVARSDNGPLPAGFALPSMPIGDSETVQIGDALTILGYPGIGGESITLTRGSVSGFLDSEDWIKTDAEINPGNSGGAAVNAAGELVGIPTAGSFDEEFPGKLGLVRPVNQARPLIDQALRDAEESP